jgi:hypothetical protein
MSMSLYLVKVTPAAGERIEADPELLLQIWGAVDGKPPTSLLGRGILRTPCD